MATVVSNKAGRFRTGTVAYGNVPNLRVIETIVDFATDVAVGATDDITLFTLPKGTLVLAMMLEQVEAGVDATNTLQGRVGSTALTATLTANAAVGTVTAQLTSTANLNVVTTADTTVNLLSATAARTTGKVRVAVAVLEMTVPQIPSLADRDALA